MDDEHVAVTNTVWVNVIEITKERDELRARIEIWGRIWNDEALLALRVEALRDGTADLGKPNGA